MVRMITANMVAVTLNEGGKTRIIHLDYGDRLPESVTAKCLEHLISLGYVSRDIAPKK